MNIKSCMHKNWACSSGGRLMKNLRFRTMRRGKHCFRYWNGKNEDNIIATRNGIPVFCIFAVVVVLFVMKIKSYIMRVCDSRVMDWVTSNIWKICSILLSTAMQNEEIAYASIATINVSRPPAAKAAVKMLMAKIDKTMKKSLKSRRW